MNIPTVTSTTKGMKYKSSWTQKGIVLVIFSLIANHLVDLENFPLSDDYRFPLSSFIISLVLGALILVIADLNFKYCEQKFFSQNITSKLIIFFLSSTLGLIALAYIPLYFLISMLQDADYSLYNLIVGLAITLLVSCLVVIAFYAKPIYGLFKVETIQGKLIIEKDSKKTIIKYADIAYIFSDNKIVYVMQTNGQKVVTNYTLNEIESHINNHLFLRANRQTLIHARAIKEVKAIENGKLSISLEPATSRNEEIGISRYKKKEFNEWFAKKQNN